MAMKRKGIFFTFAAIALSIIILFSYNAYTEYKLKDDMEVIEIRIITMNNFIKDLEDDLENAIFISGFRSLLSLEDYMMKYDKFFDPAGVTAPTRDDAFEEVFLDGTITYMNDIEYMPLMDNNTFINWTKKMGAEADKIDMTLRFTINDVTITHSDPWTVDVSVDLNILVEDKKNMALWNLGTDGPYTKNINITSKIGNIKFVDPLYLVYNDGLVNNTIRETPVDPSLSIGNLNTHLSGIAPDFSSYYIEHSDAPSYLDRFEGTLNSNPNGIESLVNSQRLIDKGLSAKDRSAVDYIYYGTQITTNCIVDDPEYSWFKLDYDPDPPNHLGFYGATCDDD